MLRSLYSGISGMKANQIKLDVNGDNIANVGTTAFKGSRVRFQDTLSQSVSEALGPGTNQGGVNAKQVGLGVNVAGIDTLTKQGNLQTTGRNLDAAIDGEGYFMVAKGPTTGVYGGTTTVDPATHLVTATGDMDISYTRDGAFTLDEQGNLLTSDGSRVMGYMMNDGANDSMESTAGNLQYCDANSASLVGVGDKLVPLRITDTVTDTTASKEVRIKSFSIEKDGVIKAVLEGGKVAALGQIAMAAFKNPAGLTKTGGNILERSANSGEAVLRSAFKDTTNDNSKGYGDTAQGMLEMSNVDLAEQFTDMIVASRAFQASSKVISTGDEILQDILNVKR